jgi:CheY-like chemotaxis protein
MSDILVVEDDENKLKEILSFLESDFGITDVDVARSYNSGATSIVDGEYKFCILDMSLPTFDVDKVDCSGRRRPFGGREILRKASKNKKVTKFVVLTQFESFGEGRDSLSKDELSEQLKQRYSDIFLELVFFSGSSSNWEKDLSRIIKGVVLC